jgi:maltooligosyltrehalose trehalohydrolase
MPVGAEIVPEGVHFRVWAPQRSRVVAICQGHPSLSLRREGEYFAGTCTGAEAGTRYFFRLDDDEHPYPDPASRFQPEGPHGPSEVIDPSAFAWTDESWPGIALGGQVLYEMHVGTFTRGGTWEAAARELPWLKDVGVTCIEMMPVAEFPGRFGWGYDGVDLFAPTRAYGRPDDLRRFVDRAHAIGLGIILDVVYNHFGPDGNYLKAFSPAYFTDRYSTEWGDAVNFDGPCAAQVREFVVENAAYWIREFHFDGLRLDATQCIYDCSDEHILAAIARRVRQEAAPRRVILVAENEPQHVRLVRPQAAGGFGLDALWNDDLHHTAVVAATGRNEAYYSDHAGAPQELISAAKWGYLLQGQRYRWQNQRRGTPALDVEPARFVAFLENHDQVANSARGRRLHQLTTPGRYRALTALILLWPGTPMLFQGQEFASSRPFLYFADHEPPLARQVAAGRAEFLSQFPSVADPEITAGLPGPGAATFECCVLDWRERETHAAVVALHRDLLRLRRNTAAFRAQAWRGVDGAVVGNEAFVLRYFDGTPGDAYDGRDPVRGDRLLLVNLGRALHLDAAPEPLLAPPEGCSWSLEWSSESTCYDGSGTPAVVSEESGWHLPGHATIVLRPVAGDPRAECGPRRAPSHGGAASHSESD